MDRPDEKSAEKIQAALFRAFAENFRWDDVPLLAYKEEGSAPFKSITRQVLFKDDALRCELLSIAGWQAAPEGVFIARERHLHALRRVDAHLMEAAALLAQQAQALDLLAEELRLAQNALSEITGEFSADDLLGVIFSRFCIGK